MQVGRLERDVRIVGELRPQPEKRLPSLLGATLPRNAAARRSSVIAPEYHRVASAR